MNENDRLKRLLVVEQITHLLLQSALMRSSPEDREQFRRDFVERIRRQTIAGETAARSMFAADEFADAVDDFLQETLRHLPEAEGPPG